MSDWQPIETAPRDGTNLLLFARKNGARAPVRVVGWFLPVRGSWVELAFAPNDPVGIIPSHWMALPSRPE
jgi:hypothetical protein